MFGIGSTELLVILIVALVVMGPKNLPKIAQSLGKAMGEFRRYSTEFQRTLNTEIAFEEEADKKKKADQELQAKAEQPLTSATPESAPVAEASPAAAPMEAKKPGSLVIPDPLTRSDSTVAAATEIPGEGDKA